nr:unnamed protein product [Callosobruchus chinensis]
MIFIPCPLCTPTTSLFFRPRFINSCGSPLLFDLSVPQ